MSGENGKRLIRYSLLVVGVWAAIRFLLPVSGPFLIGAVIALLAEPGVHFIQKKLKWPRPAASGLCVSLTLLLLTAALSVIGAVVFRELGQVARLAPAVGQTLGHALSVLEDFLVSLADRAPENIRPALIQTVLSTFQDGTALVEQVTGRIPGLLTQVISALSSGALSVGTGVLAGFFISARIPMLRVWLGSKISQSQKLLPALRRIRATFGGWLRAQLKLMGITWLVVGTGFLLLGIGYAPAWAFVVALVDAVPVLGVGTVLVPWSLVCFLQGDTLQGIGLLVIFAAAWLARSILEPKIVGRSIGLDPLVSLAAFYIGFRFWGIPGMILAPMATALGKSLFSQS